MAVKDWSTSASSNTSIDGISLAENCPFSNMNDMGRAIMANIRSAFMDMGATVTAATLTTISTPTEYKQMVGNTTISGFDTAVTGMYREIQVLSTPLLLNSSALAIQGAANYTASPGDLLRARSLGAANWVVKPERASGLPIVAPTVATGVGKHLIPFNAESLVPATTNGPSRTQTETGTNKVNVLTLDFDSSTAESAWLKFAAPTSADESKGLLYEYDWTYAATATGAGVAFSLAALAVSDNDAMDQAVGTAVTVTDSKLGAGVKHTSAQSTTVTPAGTWSAGDMLLAKIARVPSDAADLVTADAQLLAVRIFMITDDVVDTTP